MAIATGVLIEVILMIVFGLEEVDEGFDLHGERSGVARRFFVKSGNGGALLVGGGVIYDGSVLAADVVALMVDRGRVDCHEIKLDQLWQIDFRCVIDDPDTLGRLSLTCADLAVSGMGDKAVGIADLCVDDAVNLFEEMLSAPEAAPGKIDSIDFVAHSCLLKDVTCCDVLDGFGVCK